MRDSAGGRPVWETYENDTIGYTDSGTGTCSYDSADEAAAAFCREIYETCKYVRLEYSTEIYSRVINGVEFYYYTAPTVGGPHASTGINPNHVPYDGTQVAYAHTHPNSSFFSKADYSYADNHQIDAYVVGPTLEVQRYDYATQTTVPVIKISPYPLTREQKDQLQTLFSIWGEHFIDGICPSGFGCENMTWPCQ